jgi:hypothetical protein
VHVYGCVVFGYLEEWFDRPDFLILECELDRRVIDIEPLGEGTQIGEGINVRDESLRCWCMFSVHARPVQVESIPKKSCIHTHGVTSAVATTPIDRVQYLQLNECELQSS